MAAIARAADLVPMSTMSLRLFERTIDSLAARPKAARTAKKVLVHRRLRRLRLPHAA